jgi:hypothetical protein
MSDSRDARAIEGALSDAASKATTYMDAEWI